MGNKSTAVNAFKHVKMLKQCVRQLE